MKIGMTGHQNLDDREAWHWVEAVLREEIKATDPSAGITSLAIGADQRFADLIIEQGAKLQVVIPFEEYERTFDGDDVAKYRTLLAKANTVEVLEGGSTDQDGYLAAGKRIVDLSEMMVTVWNGLPAKGKGGTADIVAYALQRERPLVHVNPVDRTVTKRGF